MPDQINDGGPAFPKPHDPYPNVQNASSESRGGMTLRDWFAGQVLAATAGDCLCLQPLQAARMAYAHADAMLAVRARPTAEDR